MLDARTRRQVGLVSACIVVGALLVACGDDDDDAASVTSAAAAPLVASTEAGAVTTEAAAVTTEAAAVVTTEAAVVTTEAGEETTAAGAVDTAETDVVATAGAPVPPTPTSEPTGSSESTAGSEPGSTAPGSTAPASEICAARDELAASVNALGDISISNITSSGLSALGDAIGEVKTDLAALGSAAGSSLRSQVQDVQDNIAALETTVQALGEGITVSGVRTAAGALGDVVTSAGSLLQSLNARCPTSTAVIESIPTSSLEAVTESTG
jgi:hypothetical protein